MVDQIDTLYYALSDIEEEKKFGQPPTHLMSPIET